MKNRKSSFRPIPKDRQKHYITLIAVLMALIIFLVIFIPFASNWYMDYSNSQAYGDKNLGYTGDVINDTVTTNLITESSNVVINQTCDKEYMTKGVSYIAWNDKREVGNLVSPDNDLEIRVYDINFNPIENTELTISLYAKVDNWFISIFAGQKKTLYDNEDITCNQALNENGTSYNNAFYVDKIDNSWYSSFVSFKMYLSISMPESTLNKYADFGNTYTDICLYQHDVVTVFLSAGSLELANNANDLRTNTPELNDIHTGFVEFNS